MELLLKEVVGPFVDDKQALALAAGLDLLGRQFGLLYINIVFVSEPAQGLRISHLLMLHQKGDHGAALAASEAVEYALGGGDYEAGRLFIVEGAKALVAGARLAQGDKVGDDLDDVRTAHNLINSLVVNHSICKFSSKSRIQEVLLKQKMTNFASCNVKVCLQSDLPLHGSACSACCTGSFFVAAILQRHPSRVEEPFAGLGHVWYGVDAQSTRFQSRIYAT